MKFVKLFGTKKLAMVDDEDFEKVKNMKWHLHTCGYAVSSVWKNGSSKAIYMHRLFVVGRMIDHCDRNPLNNCRANLRICNHAQNYANNKKRKNKCIYFDKRDERYYVRIGSRGSRRHHGGAKTLKEAIIIRDKIYAKMYGEFSPF